MSDAGKAVFLSYASQDAEAAKRIADALRSSGVEVWFDQSELVGGDAWDAKIRGQISSCGLFLPLISANTQARLEGYFRLEWKLAAQRTHTMADEKAFLLPVLIDETKEAAAKVPAEFKAVQWTKLPGGETPTAFAARVKKLLSGEQGAGSGEMEAGRLRPAAETNNPEPRTENRRLGRLWWVLPIFGMAMALVLLLREKESHPEAPPKPPAAPAMSEARKLVAQARALFETDELLREDFALAEDLLTKAQALDATDGEVWAARAELSHDAIIVGLDPSGTRRENLRIQAERAMKLAPNSIEAQLAYAGYLQATGGESAAEAVRLLQPLVERAPTHHRVYRMLGFSLMTLGRLDEGIAVLDRANALSGGDPFALLMKGVALFLYGRYDEAEVAIAQSLALRPTGRARVMDTLVKLAWRGDLDGAVASLARWPAQMALEPRGAFVASQVWLWHHQPDKAIEVLHAFTSDSINDLFFNGPKPGLLALAHEMAGRSDAARAEWENTKNIATHLLVENPTQPSLLAWKGVAVARLGEIPEAESLLRRLEQTSGLSSSFWSCGATSALLRIAVNRGGEVAAKFDLEGRSDVARVYKVPSPQAALKLNPVFDPIRATPEFQKWIAAAPVPKPKPASGASLAPDDKSVAVLAFANLSDDKANEYFSDGISEELLNVLAKVPGLKVSARTSSFYFKGKQVPMAEIAQQLGVAYVVEGSVRKAGDKVRITAQLIKAADGFHVWSDTFTRDLKDVFAVQDEIAGLIARNLQLKLGASSAGRTTSVDPQAFELYVQARQAWNLRNDEGFARAEQLLNQALELAPGFARAHAARADVWYFQALTRGINGTFGRPDPPEYARVLTEVHQALALDPESAEAHASLGNVLFASWKFAEAEREYRRAIQLNPNYASAHQWLAALLCYDGRMDEALAEMQRASELDPLSSRIADNHAFVLMVAGRYSAALAMYNRALALQPSNLQAFGQRPLLLACMGRATEAVALARELPPADERTPSWQLVTYAKAGFRAEAEALLPVTKGKSDWHPSYLLLLLGRKEAAIATLDPDSTDSPVTFIMPEYDALEDDPRFQKFLATIGWAENWQRMKTWRAAHPPEKVEATK